MTFYIKQGNRLPIFSYTLKDVEGNPVDITGATSVRLHVINAYGNLVIDSPMTINNAAGGQVSYEFAAGDLDRPGVYRAEIEVKDSFNRRQTYPNVGYISIEVGRKLA